MVFRLRAFTPPFGGPACRLPLSRLVPRFPSPPIRPAVCGPARLLRDMWVSSGAAAAFLKSEGPLYEDGPMSRIELASPFNFWWTSATPALFRRAERGEYLR